MKKLITIISGILISVFSVSVAYAASVAPQTLQGNASSPNDYTPPAGYLYYELPDSSQEGVHFVNFDNLGEINPLGEYAFAINIGTQTGGTNTEVLSWISNFSLYAVIVQGEDSFHLYEYNASTRRDTNLVAPVNGAGQPEDVEFVAIVFDPSGFPAVAPGATIGLISAFVLGSLMNPISLILLITIIVLLAAILTLMVITVINIFRIKKLLINIKSGDKNINIDVDVEKNVDINTEINTEINIKKDCHEEEEYDCYKRNNWCQ